MAQVKEQAKVRQSVTFTQEQHDALCELAETYDVSFCWVVRYACNLLLSESSKKKRIIELPTARDDDERPNV